MFNGSSTRNQMAKLQFTINGLENQLASEQAIKGALIEEMANWRERAARAEGELATLQKMVTVLMSMVGRRRRRWWEPQASPLPQQELTQNARGEVVARYPRV